MFLGSFLYAADGSNLWYVSSAGSTGGFSNYAGALSQFAGGQTLISAYRPASLLGAVGQVSLAFTSSTTGTLSWPGGSVPIQRFDIVAGGSAAGPASGMPQTGWWWNPSEGGRGFFLEVQNTTLFMSGFMYDANGQATWYLTSGPMTSTALYQGQLMRCAGGQSLTGPYQPPSCPANAGPVTLQFTSQTAGSLTLPNGTAVPLQRFSF
jgi:hypothetical protein